MRYIVKKMGGPQNEYPWAVLDTETHEIYDTYYKKSHAEKDARILNKEDKKDKAYAKRFLK